MSDIWGTDGGVYLGFGSKETTGDPPPMSSPLCYVGDRHIVTIGPNGSGKTRRLLLPNLARLNKWSMLVVDPKGELAMMTARHRLAAGSDVIFLNPFNLFGMKSTGFNPVAALDPGTAEQPGEDFADDALGLAEAIIRVEGKDPHWGQAAQELIAALIMYVRLTEKSPGAGSLAEVRRLLGLSPPEFRDTIRDIMIAGIRHDWEELTSKVGRFAEISPQNNEMNSVLSTALTQTRWLDSRPIKNDLSGGTYDFSQMKQRPVTVYLILPARRLVTHSTWLRLMITSIVQPLMKDTRAAKVPVLLMLDEYFPLARGGFSVIEDNMAMFRGFGLKLWTVFQDLSQAIRLYGNSWESFVANAGVLQSYAPQDIVTANYLSERTGKTSRDLLNWSQGAQAGAQSSGGTISLSKTQTPLMLPQDLRNMDNGFFVMFSHKAKGTIAGYTPYPNKLAGMEQIMRLDPAEQPAVAP
jgi:type IV secretion system protein VirD4